MKSTNNPTIKVTVTEADILNGRPKKCGECPIALAMSRTTGQKYANVYQDWAVTYDGFTAPTLSYDLPRSAQRFIQRFDKGKPVQPFTFKLQKRA